MSETIKTENDPQTTTRPRRHPPWLRVRAPTGEDYHWLKRLMRAKQLHTVCEEAHCPNIGECWGHRTATFLILGNVCTRRCTFCAVKKGHPAPVDTAEPQHLRDAVAKLGLAYAVVTSVTRDDLPDGGASQFARTVSLLREKATDTTVEVLVPDFRGSEADTGELLGYSSAVVSAGRSAGMLVTGHARIFWYAFLVRVCCHYHLRLRFLLHSPVRRRSAG